MSPLAIAFSLAGLVLALLIAADAWRNKDARFLNQEEK
jgi:hypothetical protein